MIDFNAKLGHWPYRSVKGLDDLLRSMDRHGIERSVVSSLNAVFYLNPQDGNEEIARWVQPYRDRLIPFAVLRPDFSDWASDMMRCLDEYGMKGVVLYPNYHRYDLSDPVLAPLMEMAEERGVPVCVQAGLEDPRRQFGREIVPDVSPEAIGDFARSYPRTHVAALGLKIGQPEAVGEPLPENFFFDTSNYEKTGELEAAVARFGARRILFGTNFPLFCPMANLHKLRLADLEEKDRQGIAGGNASRLLGQQGLSSTVG